MKKLTIHLDMDGIVTDLLPRWLRAINKKFKRTITVDDVNHWDIGKLTQTHDISGKVYKMIQKPMFFYDLEPLPGSVDAVQSLVDDGHDVGFLTAPASADSAREKILWVEKHFPFINHKQITLTHRKHQVKGDVFFDDKGSGVEEYQKQHPEALVLTIEYPYNSYLKTHPTIKTVGRWDDTKMAWDEALRLIKDKANG